MNFATDLTNAVSAKGRKAAAKPARKAPAKAAAKPAKAAPRAKAAPVQAAPVLALGKPFSPKAGGLHTQVLNWEAVQAALPATAEVLIEAIKAAGGTNARGFVTGRIRDGHIKAS